MINTPDGAEQTDERRSAADRCQQHLAKLQAPLRHVQSLTQAAQDTLVERHLGQHGVGLPSLGHVQSCDRERGENALPLKRTHCDHTVG